MRLFLWRSEKWVFRKFFITFVLKTALKKVVFSSAHIYETDPVIHFLSLSCAFIRD